MNTQEYPMTVSLKWHQVRTTLWNESPFPVSRFSINYLNSSVFLFFLPPFPVFSVRSRFLLASVLLSHLSISPPISPPRSLFCPSQHEEKVPPQALLMKCRFASSFGCSRHPQKASVDSPLIHSARYTASRSPLLSSLSFPYCNISLYQNTLPTADSTNKSTVTEESGRGGGLL